MEAKTVLNYNFKGGVGKTTITAMEGYILSHRHKKVLLVDFDPQANLTDVIHLTYHKNFEPTTNMLIGLADGDLTDSVCKVNDYLDIIPTDWNLIKWSERAEKVGSPNKYYILDFLLKPFKNKYDYIFIDVPPTFAPYSLNAIFAADDIAIVLETQHDSYTSALKTVKTIGDLKNKYHIKYQFLGVILYLMINAKTDREVSKDCVKTFKNFLYTNRIYRQERVKVFSKHGITDKDYWDKKAIGMYNTITMETIKKIERLNK